MESQVHCGSVFRIAKLYFTNEDTEKGHGYLRQAHEGILKKMMHIYKEDLIESSDYGSLVLHERERSKSIFIEVCQKLSSIYIKRGESRQAEEVLKRALAAEPFNENICL